MGLAALIRIPTSVQMMLKPLISKAVVLDVENMEVMIKCCIAFSKARQ